MTAPAQDARSTPAKRRRVQAVRHGLGEFARRESRMFSAGIMLVAGIVFILLGWYGAAHTNILTEQIPYLISGGLLGLGLLIVAGVMASSAAVERDNRALREDLLQVMETIGRAAAAPRSGTASSDVRVYAVSGGHSFHLTGCPILEGKDAREMTPADAFAERLASCKLCGPD